MFKYKSANNPDCFLFISICPRYAVLSKGQVITSHYRFLANSGGFVWAETQATVLYSDKTSQPEAIICLNFILRYFYESRQSLFCSNVRRNQKQHKNSSSSSSSSVPWSSRKLFSLLSSFVMDGLNPTHQRSNQRIVWLLTNVTLTVNISPNPVRLRIRIPATLHSSSSNWRRSQRSFSSWLLRLETTSRWQVRQAKDQHFCDLVSDLVKGQNGK